jgi:cyanophycin synthetase
MRILSLRYFAGPNIYSYSPVVKVTVDIGRYEYLSTKKIAGFTDHLLDILPTLSEHQCSKGYPGGFVERLREGTYLAHVFEHVALELQNLVGYSIGFGKARSTDRPGIYDAVYGCTVPEVGRAVARHTEVLINRLVACEPVDISRILDDLQEVSRKYRLGPSTQALVNAAKERGIPVTSLDDDSLCMFGYGKKQQRIWATLTGRTSNIATDVACHKQLTNRLLADNAIPVPDGTIVSSVEEAQDVFRSFHCSVVVKPLNGNQGRGVTLNINSAAEVARAYNMAAQFNDEVLMEEFIPGRQYRLCVVNGKLIAAAERLPAQVTGDGQHTVKELVDRENANGQRGEDHEKPLTKIRIDAIALVTLARQNLADTSIPKVGQIVVIRENANISTGGTAIDVTDQVHPDTVAIVERASRVIDLDVAGVDLVTDDITQPLVPGRGAVIEINAAPGIRMHHYPSAGKARDVAGAILEYLFPDQEKGRIPIVSITGTNGKTTVTRMIGHVLEQVGLRVGMTTTDGIFIDGHCIVEGDTTGPASAKIILSDPSVEAAVLETARGGILRAGLAFDYCDVGIVTNITEDHLGQYGIDSLADMANIKSLILERTKRSGYALINADDPNVVSIAARVKAHIVYFSLEADNIVIRRHLGVGGKAFFVREGTIYAARGNQSRPIVRIADIPVTFGGAAVHNVQNALIAVAAAASLNISPQHIKHSLCSFEKNPGRLTMRDIAGIRICVDYGHNPAGYEALIQTVKKLGAKRLIGVIAAPGDRPDRCIISMGKSAGYGFDQIIIKEDSDLRGRESGQVAALLKAGTLDSGHDPASINIIYSEAEAVRRALKMAEKGDLIVVFYEKYRIVNDVIDDFERQATEKKLQQGIETLPNDQSVAASGKTF